MSPMDTAAPARRARGPIRLHGSKRVLVPPKLLNRNKAPNAKVDPHMSALLNAAASVDRMFESENEIRQKAHKVVTISDELIGNYESYIEQVSDQASHGTSIERPDIAQVLDASEDRREKLVFLNEFIKGHEEFEVFKQSFQATCLETLLEQPLVTQDDAEDALIRHDVDHAANESSPKGSRQQSLATNMEQYSEVLILQNEIQEKLRHRELTHVEAIKMKTEAACKYIQPTTTKNNMRSDHDFILSKFKTQTTHNAMASQLMVSTEENLQRIMEELEQQRRRLQTLESENERLKADVAKRAHENGEIRKEVLLMKCKSNCTLDLGPVVGQDYVKPPPPSGQVAIVHACLWRSGDDGAGIWNGDTEVMRETLKVFNHWMQSLMMLHKGHEIASYGDQLAVAFDDAKLAFTFCSAVQTHLLTAPWPEAALMLPGMQIEYTKALDAILWRGPRVCMAVHFGDLSEMSLANGPMSYYGYHYEVSRGLGYFAGPGEVLLTQQAFAALQVSGLKGHVVNTIGYKYIITTQESIVAYQLVVNTLEERIERNDNTRSSTTTIPTSEVVPSFTDEVPNIKRLHSWSKWITAKKAALQYRFGAMQTLQEGFDRVHEGVDISFSIGLTLVMLDMEVGTSAWTNDCPGMCQILRTYHTIIKEHLHTTGGYVMKNTGDMFKLVFVSAREAVAYCVVVQEALMAAEWPEHMLEKYPEFKATTFVSKRPGMPDHVAFRGPRVRIAVQNFERENGICTQYDDDGQLLDIQGPDAQQCAQMLQMCMGGETLISTRTYQVTKGVELPLVSAQPEINGLLEVRKARANVTLDKSVYQVLPSTLVCRDQHFAEDLPPAERGPGGVSELVWQWLKDRELIRGELDRLDDLLQYHESPPQRTTHFIPNQKQLVPIVVCNIDNLVELLEAVNVRVLKETLVLYHGSVAAMLDKHKGLGFNLDGFRLVAAFNSSVNAISFATELQMNMMVQPWDPSLLEAPCCRTLRDKNGKPIIRGPRVALAVDVGVAELVEDNDDHEGPSNDAWAGVDDHEDPSKNVWEGMNGAPGVLHHGAPGVLHHETQSRGAHDQSRCSRDKG